MIRLPSRKTLVLLLAGLVAFYLLFGWLALPPLLQSQAEEFIVGKTGHRLSMDRPEFNPFELSLRLSGLHLAQPDGEPLLAFRELVVDLSAASIFQRGWVFDGIRLDGLEAKVTLLPQGRLNWSALITALKSKEGTPDQPLPRFDIQHLVLAGARVDFADQRIKPAFATRIEPIDLELTELSSQPDEQGQYKFSARTAFGARVDWQGDVSLEPLAATGRFSLEGVELGRLAGYFRNGLPLAPPEGIAGVTSDYRLGFAKGRLAMNLENLSAKLTSLKLQGKQGAGPALVIDSIDAKAGSYDLASNRIALGALKLVNSRLDLRPAGKPAGRQGGGGAPAALALGSIVVEDAVINLTARQATLGRIALNAASVRLTRNAQGRIDLVDAVQAAFPPARSEPPRKVANAPAAADWRYRLGKLELSGGSVALRDEAVMPAAELTFEDIALSLANISENPQAAMPLRVSFKAKQGGSFEADGEIVRGGPRAEFRLKLTDFGLAPVQPYLSAAARLTLSAGRLSATGRAGYNAQGASYRGSFALADLRLTESATGNLFMSWKSLGSQSLEVTPRQLEIDELVVAGLDTKLIIDQDKSTSIKRIMRQTGAVATPVEQTPATQATAKAPPPFLVNIGRLRFSRGEMDFADYSLALPFATRIHHLRGSVAGLSSRPGAMGQVELEGEVDDYGLARAVGQIDLFNPTNFMDLKLVFRNIEMTRLTPYSGTFAGRKIASGKLSLDLAYKIQQRQLLGENQVVMEQLTLGERVDSPTAVNLPLDLAIAILQDAEGRIELGLPVAGSLDDPQFSYGGIVWKAIVNVLTKIATAPFRALGALFGGGGEKFENIAFEAGNAHLTPPEREKLVRLAGALVKRPGLSLAVHGVYAGSDRAALQDRQLRRSVAEKSGLPVEADRDPGPISTRQPKVQAALEGLFAERFGGAELTATQEGFRKANPGQLEQSAGGKVLSRLSGLFGAKRTLDAQEVARMQGGDYYAILFDRLRDKIMIDDASLLNLAKARGLATVAALQAAGAPAARLALLPAEKVAAAGRDVPVKLVLGSAAKTATPAAEGASAN